MARENRRKKKAYLETVEKELEKKELVNAALMKALKKQQKVTERLEREKRYYQNILANRTEILKLISVLNTRLGSSNNIEVPLNRACLSPSDSSVSSAYRECRDSSYEPESLTNYNFENSESGSVAAEQKLCDSYLPICSSNFFDQLTDFEPSSTLNDRWNEILDDDFGLKGVITEQQKSEDKISTSYISEEHSYGNIDNKILNRDDSNDVGVCLHITRGKVSLEFCPNCHWSAGNTPPTQLMQDPDFV